MPDMLVRLYDLPDYSGLVAELKASGVEIRRALALEKHTVLKWVTKTFSLGWANEAERGIMNTPSSTFIATENGSIIGFAVHDATCKDFFGPTGVAESARGRGIGKALLWVCLHAMAEQGYGYAIIGWAGPGDFYAKAVGAVPIEGSEPGVYRGILW